MTTKLQLSNFSVLSSTQFLSIVTDSSGTGLNVFNTSPILITPNLGTPSVLIGTNITGTATLLNIGGNSATTTLASNSTSLGGALANTFASLTSPTFLGIPTAVTAAINTNTTQLSTCEFVQSAITASSSIISMVTKSIPYTLILSDVGVLHPSDDATARTFTIDSNANVAYPLYKVLTFVNHNGAGVVTIAITTDTMRLSPSGTTGNRTLAANGFATAVKLSATEWIISGTGLS